MSLDSFQDLNKFVCIPGGGVLREYLVCFLITEEGLELRLIISPIKDNSGPAFIQQVGP